MLTGVDNGSLVDVWLAGLFKRSTEYHFPMASAPNQKVMIPRFTND